MKQRHEAEVAQLVSARLSELEDRQFDPRHSIDVCFDFSLFRVAVALNTRETEHWQRKGARGAHRGPQVELLRATHLK